LRGDALVIASLLAIASCATSGRTGSLKQLARCDAPALRVTPHDWQRIEQGDSFLLFIPPSCTPDPAPQRFVHGGTRWHCGTLSVQVVWGMWGSGSAAEAAGEGAGECRAVFSGGVPVLVSTPGRTYRRAVWYLTGYPHEPLVVASSAFAEDIPLLETVTRSGVLAGPRGPNR